MRALDEDLLFVLYQGMFEAYLYLYVLLTTKRMKLRL